MKELSVSALPKAVRKFVGADPCTNTYRKPARYNSQGQTHVSAHIKTIMNTTNNPGWVDKSSNGAGRKSIRLKHYNYSNKGLYYLTICTQNRKCVFGKINNGEMVLNDAGEMVNQWFLKIANRFDNIKLDEYQLMPNHVHAIIVSNGRIHGSFGSTHGSTPTAVIKNPVGADLRVRPSHGDLRVRLSPTNPPTLGKIIQWFKTMTTNHYIRGVKQNGWQPFNKRLWQRNYWEHIIRDNDSLDKIRIYIKNNPTTWRRDRNNPKNMKIIS